MGTFVDVARPKAQTGDRRHPHTDGVAGASGHPQITRSSTTGAPPLNPKISMVSDSRQTAEASSLLLRR
jgi:hypothetical protein